MAHKLCYFVLLVITVWQTNSQDSFICIIPSRYGPVLAECPFKGHTGNCTQMMECGFIYPESYSHMYRCYSDLDCSAKMKCCEHPCYEHNVCVIATVSNTTKTAP
ncbi:WAP-type (Whey Acidic Protein) 'four-disulfide core' [Popillia japonica]|uniref:WAP-type (Whey Acidic Protein) 'four-disulfide core n=1 Tax=Popillia japonica TaxID=7064 RepID=A0AAW1MCR6_POPJA